MRAMLVAAGMGAPSVFLATCAAQCEILVAVDGGWNHCIRAGLHPQLLLGDFDSLGAFSPMAGVEVIQLPVEKDDTDTLFAVRHLISLGYDSITLCCALGGRLDHTVANLQVLAYMRINGVDGCLLDSDTCVQVFTPGTITLEPETYDVFSLFSLDEQCEGVTIEGAKYPLSDYQMRNSFPVGVSNVFLSGAAYVRFSSGKLLVIRSRIENTLIPFGET